MIGPRDVIPVTLRVTNFKVCMVDTPGQKRYGYIYKVLSATEAILEGANGVILIVYEDQEL